LYYEMPGTVQEAHNATYTAVAEIAAGFIRPHKHQVQPEHVRAKVCDVVVGIDDVAFRLGNLRPVFGDGSIGAESLEWLIKFQVVKIIQCHRDEPRIHQLHHPMLPPTDIHTP